MVAPEAVVDIKGIPGLDRIEFKNGVLSIGALVTFSDLRESAVIAQEVPRDPRDDGLGGVGGHPEPGHDGRQSLLRGALLRQRGRAAGL